MLAAHRAAKGKREKANVLQFFSHLEENIQILIHELENRTYQPGEYNTFNIYEPKPRMISAAPFRDRVVHHALLNVIEPLFERSFIFDSYANRVGKGTHCAIRRYQKFLRSHEYVLKCDIKKYFASIDHEILKVLLRKRVADKKVLWLIDVIIDNSNHQENVIDYFPGDDLFTPLSRRKGLPIGNLTSQFYANVYLNQLDHFVKEILHCPAYIRYVDDFVLFSNLKSQLKEWLDQLSCFLIKLRLKLNTTHCSIYPARIGGRFLGQLIFRTHRRLASDNVKRFKKRLRKWQNRKPANVQQCIASWVGHAKQADTEQLLMSLGLF